MLKYLVDEVGLNVNVKASYWRDEISRVEDKLTLLDLAVRNRWFEGVYFLINRGAKGAKNALDHYYDYRTGNDSHVVRFLEAHLS